MKKFKLIFFLLLLCIMPFRMQAEVLSVSEVESTKIQEIIGDPARGGIAYNGEYYLYISPSMINATVYKSEDGVTWKRLNAMIDYGNHASSFRSVTRLIWDGKQFVAACNEGIITSIDGEKWKERTPDLWKSEKFIGDDIAFTGKEYVIIGNLAPKAGGWFFPTPTLLYTENLDNYLVAQTTNLTKDGFGHERPFQNLLYGNNKLLALGVQTIASSTDGKKWTGYVSRSSVMSDHVEPSGETIWDGEKYVTVTDAGIYYSKDAKVWTPALTIQSALAEKIYLTCIAYNGTDYIASGASYENALIYYHSKDGKKWTKKIHPGVKANIRTIYPTQSGFLAGGSSLYKITTRKTGTLSTWSQSTVNEAIAKKIYSYRIAPYYQGAATRLEVAQLISNAYEYAKQTEIVYPANIQFKDTQDSAVLKAAQLKIMNGLATTIFGTESTMTKEQLSVILGNLASQLNIKLVPSKALAIKDQAKIAAWSKSSVELMVNSGIMSLDNNNNFNPKAEVSLEQSIVLIMNIVNRV